MTHSPEAELAFRRLEDRYPTLRLRPRSPDESWALVLAELADEIDTLADRIAVLQERA